MLYTLLLAYVSAYQHPTNSIFDQEPTVSGLSSTTLRIKYAIGRHNIKIKLGIGDLNDISSSLTYYYNSIYYGFADLPLSINHLNWEVTDYSGRISECKTTFEQFQQVSEPSDPCEATGCYESILGDGWCDKICLNSACGFDRSDCEERDILGLIMCDPAQISNLICNQECNNIIGMFDGGDCSTECARQGCNLNYLKNEICDVECNIEACDWDKGDCNNCAPGCKQNLINNGSCDQKCNVESCNFDGDDCLSLACEAMGCDISKLENNFCDPECNFPQCNYDNRQCLKCSDLGCSDEILGNNLCDEVCNVPECKYDEGDCIDKHVCHIRECDDDDLGNGDCDVECNHPECSYDLGDCYEKLCNEGCLKVMLGNGRCDDECNISYCNYDQHDCLNESSCDNECFRDIMNDEICDDACNNENCEYDNGDCSSLVYQISEGSLYYEGKSYKATTVCLRDSGLYLTYSLILALIIYII